MSRSSPAPRGFRGTPTLFRVGQNNLDGRHFTSLASSVQRTELRYPLEGFRSSCEAPRPPTSLSPRGSKNRWQVLRELRETLCQRNLRPPRSEGEIKHLCPELRYLSTTFIKPGSHTNHLVASFPQRGRSARPPTPSPQRASPSRELELRGCNSLEPATVGVTPAPAPRRGARRGRDDL